MNHPVDFWRNSGFHLLERNDDGYLAVNDDLLRAYLFRPEMAPVEESCPAELSLHAALVETPTRAVSQDELRSMVDPDTAENYRIVLGFRDLLLSAGTIEAAYATLFEPGRQITMPPLFIDHLAHAAARNMLDGATDAFRVRAAEALFREQVVTTIEGAILLADAETVDLRRERREQGGFSLLDIAAAPDMANDTIELDVLSEENCSTYWKKSDNHDLALDITFPRAGLDGLARVLEDWVRHFHRVEVEIQPTQRITDERWIWHIGLDTESTDLLNDLYNGRTIDDERNERLLSLFRMNFRDPGDMRADLAGRPVYLGLCRTVAGRLRMKPQNLLVNMPLAGAS